MNYDKPSRDNKVIPSDLETPARLVRMEDEYVRKINPDYAVTKKDKVGFADAYPILIASDEEKMRAYADPAIREKLHAEVVTRTVPHNAVGFSKTWWDYMWVNEPVLEKNKVFKTKLISTFLLSLNQWQVLEHLLRVIKT